jgi:hypothetical protein
MTRQVTSPDQLPYYQASDTPDGAAQQQDLANTVQATFTANRVYATGLRTTQDDFSSAAPATIAVASVASAPAGSVWEATAHVNLGNLGASTTSLTSTLSDGTTTGTATAGAAASFQVCVPVTLVFTRAGAGGFTVTCQATVSAGTARAYPGSRVTVRRLS